MVNHTADFAVRSGAPADTAAIADAIAQVLEPGDVLVLGGEMGAGKTTFTKALGLGLGIDEPITSPTFTLAQQYDGGRLTLHHLDVYRIDQIDEVIDLALPELYESGGVVAIEWGDTIAPALPAEYVVLQFVFGEGDDDRTLTFSAFGQTWAPRVPILKDRLASLLVDPAAPGSPAESGDPDELEGSLTC